MVKFKPAKFLSKIRPPEYLKMQAARLLLTLTLFFLSPSLINLQLGNAYPPISEESVLELPIIIPTPAPSPIPSPSAPVAKTKDVILDTQHQPAVKVASKNLSGLCSGVVEEWKLVPNPEVEGQYVICNSTTGQMATASELNTAQNNYRVNNGLNSLSINGELCTIATERAREVADNFSHDGFEAAINRHNLQKSAVGENIASGPLTAVQFVEWSWDKSPGHRENMLGDWNEGCAGVYDRFAVFIFAK